MTKRAIEIGNNICTLADTDSHFVVVRPKALIDSSGTTWASEIVRLRTNFPDIFELSSDSNLNHYSAACRGNVAMCHITVLQYLDMTEAEDIQKITVSEKCPHREYEKKRLTHLLDRLNEAENNIAETPRYLFQICIIKPLS